MSELAKKLVVVLVAITAGSCAASEPPSSLMGNTNWLTSCEEDDDCGDDLACSCGVCTRECTTTDDCSGLGRAVCDEDSESFASACGGPAAMSVCLPECSDEDECGEGLACVEAHCLPMEEPEVPPPSDGEQIGCGPKGAFVSNNIAPDGDCAFSAEGSQVVPNGTFDVSSGLDSATRDSCGERPYNLALLVYSCLQGVDDTLQIHSATVELRDTSGAVLQFNGADLQLPNPFQVISNSSLFPMRDGVPTSGVAFVEVIPAAYAEQLASFDGRQLHAEIRLHATTVGEVDVDLNPFSYAIQICDGCLTVCGADVPLEASPEEIYGEGRCADNAGADGRICVDWTCN